MAKPDPADPAIIDLPAMLGRNPNTHPDLNDAPDGPFGPEMGNPDRGGMEGDTSVKGKNGMTFEFK